MLVFLRCTLIIFLNLCLCLPLVFCEEPVSNCADKDQLCLNYNKALESYQQLKYLEEKQLWDDYFAKGNTYRNQIVENTKKVIDQSDNKNPLRLKSRLLIWQFHQDQQDAFIQQALDDLIADVNAYALQANDPKLIKDVADKLMSYEEKSKARQIYKLYVDQLVTGQVDDAGLKSTAAGFYKEGNLELAQGVYDIYIERISKTFAVDKLTRELFEIASLFVYKAQGLYDIAYAEKIYERIEGLERKDVFNQETIYLRAFNLEKYRDYKGAVKFYLELIQLYPDTKYYDEAVYKIGMINAYALANINEARKYFDILCAKTAFSPQVISSFYQLGLLAQWQGDLVKAKEQYELLLKNSQSDYASLTAQAKDRLKEIEENKQLSYNLKTFLDLSLKNAIALSEMGRADLKVSSYLLSKGQEFTVSSFMNMPQSGCNQVDLQYIWSGDLGRANPSVTEGEFQCAYSDAGTKVINVVVILPAGAIDRFFTMVDVY